MKPAAKRLFGILASLVLVVASLVVYSSLLLPKYADIQELRGEREALTQLLQEQMDAVDAVQRLVRQYSDVTDLQRSLAITLPIEEEVASIVNQLQGIASTNGMLMSSLSMRPMAIEPTAVGDIVRPVGILRISVDLIGDYTSLKAYLEALETNVRIMDVRSIQVQNAGTSDGPYDYQLEIDTYYQL